MRAPVMNKPSILYLLEGVEESVKAKVEAASGFGSMHCTDLTCREVIELLDYMAHIRALASAAQGGRDASPKPL